MLKQKPSSVVINENCFIVGKRVYSTQSECSYLLLSKEEADQEAHPSDIFERDEEDDRVQIISVASVQCTSLIAATVLNENAATLSLEFMQNPGLRRVTYVGPSLLNSVSGISFLAG